MFISTISHKQNKEDKAKNRRRKDCHRKYMGGRRKKGTMERKHLEKNKWKLCNDGFLENRLLV